MIFVRRLLAWLHSILVKTFPPGSPQEGNVELQRVLGSVQAVNACLPQAPASPDSGTATATAGLLTQCSTLDGAFSVFVLQVQVAICWLWSQLSGSQTAITALQVAVAALQASIPSPIPGTVSVAPGNGLGAGGTAVLVAGSTTSIGVISCVAGTSPGSSGGIAAILHNTSGWPTNFSLKATEGKTSNDPLLIDYFTQSGDIYLNFYPVQGVFNTGDTFDISYSIDALP